jgi:hypothetical protein
MTNNVTKVDDGNKAAELSNPGKLLRAYMQATGIYCAKTLADSLGIKLRTIQRLKLEIATCANDAKCAIYGAANSANDAIYGVSEAPVAPDMALSCVRVEDNNITTNLETTVVEVKCSEVSLLRSDEPKPKKQAYGTRLDPSWTLSEDLRQWTRARFPQTTDERLADELENFHDYWKAQAGQRGRKADWDATWRTWSKRAFATAPIRPRAADGERPVSSWEAEKAAKHARIRALMESVGGSA